MNFNFNILFDIWHFLTKLIKKPDIDENNNTAIENCVSSVDSIKKVVQTNAESKPERPKTIGLPIKKEGTHKSSRPCYYEDDAVQYASRGHHPVIPKRYEYCHFHGHKLKAFWSEKHATTVLNVIYRNNPAVVNKYTVFRCPVCQMWHLMLKKNYDEEQIG